MSLFQIDRRPTHDPMTCSRDVCGRCSPAKGSKAPAIGKNPHDSHQEATKPDPIMASMGLPGHPDPNTIAAVFEGAAKALRSHGFRAMDLASVLAAKGYSARTLGDGGSRGTDTTSSTERLAARPGRFDAVDHAYAALLRLGWSAGLNVKALTDELVRHADDVDPTPAGTGECRGCARYCKNNGGDGDRLRSGLCQTCYRAWRRYVDAKGPDMWSVWVGKRRESYTERDPDGRIVRVHTPEPDHGDSTDTGSEQGDP